MFNILLSIAMSLAQNKTQAQVSTMPVAVVSTTPIVVYDNLKEPYSLSFPNTWYRTDGHLADMGGDEDIFQISNHPTTESQKKGFNTNTSSLISVDVALVSKRDSITTIDDLMRASARDFPLNQQAEIIKSRLAGISTMSIGGASLRVWHYATVVSDTYRFIYKNKDYTIKIESFAASQLAVDEPVFNALVGSIVLR